MRTTTLSNSFAAIDLGSNSFHMVVAEPEGNSIRIVDSLRVPVRLGAGLDKHKKLKRATRDLAMDALGQFAQRLRGIPLKNIRVVGTNTLRRAKDSTDFMIDAFAILGKRIEIISGREEARLIFSAVSHALPDATTKRLVIDIGGGSTELIIGRGFVPELMESINIGCVSYTSEFMQHKQITAAHIKQASVQAQLELRPIVRAYLNAGWTEVTGCSGTIKAVARILAELSISDGEITRDALRTLIKRIDKAGGVELLELNSISSDRASVICGGIAILHALFKTLSISSMQASQVALREGLIFDMVGKAEHINIQSQTIANLVQRYSIDQQQAARVQATVRLLFAQTVDPWRLDEEVDLQQLGWAAKLHELGMGLAHTQYHKHGAYILENSDLLGFSMAEQKALALLVRFHRRKIDLDAFAGLPDAERERLLRLVSLLRLAVLLHRGRDNTNVDVLKLKVSESRLTVVAPAPWLEAHPLTAAELKDEADRLLHVDFQLKSIEPD